MRLPDLIYMALSQSQQLSRIWPMSFFYFRRSNTRSNFDLSYTEHFLSGAGCLGGAGSMSQYEVSLPLVVHFQRGPWFYWLQWEQNLLACDAESSVTLYQQFQTNNVQEVSIKPAKTKPKTLHFLRFSILQSLYFLQYQYKMKLSIPWLTLQSRLTCLLGV